MPGPRPASSSASRCRVRSWSSSTPRTTPPYPSCERVATTSRASTSMLNTYGRGPANAIRFGIDHARRPCAVVTMADGCDDPAQIDDLARLVERGVVVAAASRYCAAGQQVGGPAAQGSAVPPGRQESVLARPGRHPRRHQLVQGLLRGVRARGRRSRATRASRSASSSWPRPVGPACRSPRSRPSGSTVRSVRRTSSSRPGSLATCTGTSSPSGRADDLAGLPAPSPPTCRKALSSCPTVLVTGSAGFIGGYVVEELLGHGYEVVGLDNFSKYGTVAKSYDSHPRLPLRRG